MHSKIPLISAMVLCLGMVSISFADPIIIDHTTTDLSQIPNDWINQVKNDMKLYFGHTSHGTQITNGLLGLSCCSRKGIPSITRGCPDSP
jgi:hypothetical protein